MYSVQFGPTLKTTFELTRFPSKEQAIGFASSLFPAVDGSIEVRPVLDEGKLGSPLVTLEHLR